jgi:hypothetical protein
MAKAGGRTTMRNRLRMLMGATALLYIGPLTAGLGGFGWAVVPIFAAIFMLWLFILRPHQWPRNMADWTRPEALISLLTQGVVQLLLVTILFGVGRGIGGVLGTLPQFPLMLPIATSFLSIPLARLVWNPWAAQGVDRFLDDAIARVNATADDMLNPGIDLARRLIAPLSDLPAEISETEVARHLIALSTQASPADIRKALFERLRDEVATPAEVVALILHTTDATLIAEVPGEGPTLCLTRLTQTRQSRNPAHLALFARRLAVALDHDAEIWGKCPSVDLLADLVTEYDNTDAEAPLRYLIEATNRAEPEDGLD